MMKKIGIGAQEDLDKVIASIQKSGLQQEILIYCLCVPDNPVDADVAFHETKKPEEDLVRDLASGTIRAAVRGTLPANSTLSALKRAFSVDHLERVALLETADGRKFLLAPVGVDEGWSVGEKVTFVKKGRAIAEKYGLPDKVAVLSGGRIGDVGRNARVDQSLADAELVARLSGAVHREILIEDAIKDSGLIIAPDGISGNLIFRTLTFLGAGKGHGAPVVNIDGIFVDTSRASPDYVNAIMLADSLSKQ
jgi:putative methanogen marker protein 4